MFFLSTYNCHELTINYSEIIYMKKKLMINSLQDLHEVPEHLWSARKRHRSALCDALPDKEVPSAWALMVIHVIKHIVS